MTYEYKIKVDSEDNILESKRDRMGWAVTQFHKRYTVENDFEVSRKDDVVFIASAWELEESDLQRIILQTEYTSEDFSMKQD